ncbi:MAG: hypothetical protein CMF48_01755 [Legionellales bacterium]|nr:hypothetical protein [Legionellales bacterium]
MSNNQLLLLLGAGIFGWGLWEFLNKKAYVRVDWGWEYRLINKEDQPFRYWSSCIGKSFVGLFMVVVAIYRYVKGET